MRTSRKWVCAGAFLGFLSVIAGAAGTHWLDTFLDEKYADTFQTAVGFHMVHSVALVAVAVVVERYELGILHSASLWLLLAGVIIFCGSLYVLAFTQIWVFGVTAPVGGICLLLGWLALAFGTMRPGAEAE
mgnify:FL=1